MGIRSFIATIMLALLCGCPQQQASEGQSPDAAAPARQSSAPRMLSVVCDPLLTDLLSELQGSLPAEVKGLELQPLESGELRQRIESGADFSGVDAFIFADPAARKALTEAGLLSDPTIRTFAGDRLALICRKGESWHANMLFDIYRLRFKWIGIGSEDTANGFYARQALVSDGVMPRVEDRLSLPGDVATILSDLLVDENTQLAIVPRSSILGNDELKIMLLLGRDLHEDFLYQAAAASGREDDAAVMALLTGLAEDSQVQELIAGYGFDNRDEAMGLNVEPE